MRYSILQGCRCRAASVVGAEGIKSIKNMVIREAVRYAEGYLYTEDEGLEDLETEREELDGADDLEVAEDMEEVS